MKKSLTRRRRSGGGGSTIDQWSGGTEWRVAHRDERAGAGSRGGHGGGRRRGGAGSGSGQGARHPAQEFVVGGGGPQLVEQLLQSLAPVLTAQRPADLGDDGELGRLQQGLVVPRSGAREVDGGEQPALGEGAVELE